MSMAGQRHGAEVSIRSLAHGALKPQSETLSGKHHGAIQEVIPLDAAAGKAQANTRAESTAHNHPTEQKVRLNACPLSTAAESPQASGNSRAQQRSGGGYRNDHFTLIAGLDQATQTKIRISVNFLARHRLMQQRTAPTQA